MQSDPQVPALIQQIDELMGGLLDSPELERKEQPPYVGLNVAATSTASAQLQEFANLQEYSLPLRMNGNGVPERRDVVVASESPFPRNINPADFLRDEEIRIDPRNFLNTPSPEPNLLDLKVASSSSTSEMAASGLSAGGYQHSPLIGGILSTVRRCQLYIITIIYP